MHVVISVWPQERVHNFPVSDEIVPADAHYAAEGFCVEGIEAFLLRFGKYP